MKIFYNFYLEPDERQADLINKHIDASAYVYNWALREKIERQGAGYVRDNDIIRLLPDLRRNNPWLAHVAYEVEKASVKDAFRKSISRQPGQPAFSRKFGKTNRFYCQYSGGKGILDNDNRAIHLPILHWIPLGKFIGGESGSDDMTFHGAIHIGFTTINKYNYRKYSVAMLIDTDTFKEPMTKDELEELCSDKYDADSLSDPCDEFVNLC